MSSPVHEFVSLVSVADSDPRVTVGTLEPFVVQPDAVKAIAVDSALPPLVVSGGENVNAPVMSVQVTAPVARVSVVVGGAALGLGLELQAVARVAITPSGTSRLNRTARIMDMACSPWSVPTARYRTRCDGSGHLLGVPKEVDRQPRRVTRHRLLLGRSLTVVAWMWLGWHAFSR
jgi:hypothetical protein